MNMVLGLISKFGIYLLCTQNKKHVKLGYNCCFRGFLEL